MPEVSDLHTARPCIIVGAFDRHNFGDLLFPHLAAAMLPGRELVFTGVAARDLRPFAQVLAGAGGMAMASTNAGHLAPTRGGDPHARPDRLLTERAPNGNGVTLDREALPVADTDTAHALATGLHRRYLGLFRTALGRSQ